MTKYEVILDGVPAVAVEITCSDGAHSLRGFSTEAAALMWIADQEFRAVNAEAATTGACIRLRGSEDRALVALYGVASAGPAAFAGHKIAPQSVKARPAA